MIINRIYSTILMSLFITMPSLGQTKIVVRENTKEASRVQERERLQKREHQPIEAVRQEKERQKAEQKDREERIIREAERERLQMQQELEKEQQERDEYAQILRGDIVVLEQNKNYISEDNGQTLWDCWDYSIGLNADGTATVYHYRKGEYSRSIKGELKVPSMVKYNGNYYKVTCIGPNTFGSSVQNLTLPSTLKRLERCALAGCSMQSIEIPGGITYIGDSAFYGCDELKAIKWPKEIERIGDGMFNNCKAMTSCEIPPTVTSIGAGAFFNCGDVRKATPIVLPDGLISIGEDAFFHSPLANGVQVPASVEFIGERAFSQEQSISLASGNRHYTLENGLLLNSDKTLLLAAFGQLKECRIPPTVMRICNSAFYGMETLKTIFIPSSVQEIGSSAFANTGLETVTLPLSVEYMGESAFSWCKSLVSATLPANLDTIPDGSFWWCKKLSSVTLPLKLKAVGKRAFEDCDELTELSFPNSLSKIGTYAFSGCNKLKELVLPASLIDELPWTAVQYDDKLTNVTFIYNSGKKEKVPRKNYWRRY